MKKIKDYLKKIRCQKNYTEFEKNCIHGQQLYLRNTSHCHASNKKDIVIGSRCEIKGTLYSFEGGKISIGNNVFISFSTYIGAMDSINIGDDVIIASNVRIFDNNNHPTDPDMRRKMSHNDFYGDLWTWKYAAHKPVIIEDNVWIGEYSAILKGVTIGEGSIVGCHSVVTKDVPPYSIVAGNPARVVKKIERGNSFEEN